MWILHKRESGWLTFPAVRLSVGFLLSRHLLPLSHKAPPIAKARQFFLLIQSWDTLAWSCFKVSVQCGPKGQELEREWSSIHPDSICDENPVTFFGTKKSPTHPVVSLDDCKWLKQAHRSLKSHSKWPRSRLSTEEPCHSIDKNACCKQAMGFPGACRLTEREPEWVWE